MYKLNKGKALVLRSCAADMTSKRGFVWPQVGETAKALDWAPTKECGAGLHGWLYGQGDHSCSNYLGDDAKWLVVEVDESTIIMLGGKCKFPEGKVVFVGTRSEAADFIIAHEPRAQHVAVIGLVREVGDNGVAEGGAFSTLTGGYGSTLTGGYGSTLTGGSRSTLTGGDGSTLTGGYGSTLTGGDGSTLTGGDGSTLTGGYGSTLTGGDGSTLTGGYGSTLTGGSRSTLTGGDGSTLTGGYGSTLTGGSRSTLTGGYGSTLTGGSRSTLTGGSRSTLTGGDGSTLTGGDGSTLTGGDGSELRIQYWDGKNERYRTAIAYVGEDGIEPNKPYNLSATGKFVRVDEKVKA